MLGHLQAESSAAFRGATVSLSARRGEAECDVAGRLPDDFVRLIRGGRCRQNTDADVTESKRVFFNEHVAMGTRHSALADVTGGGWQGFFTRQLVRLDISAFHYKQGK